jgi:hypothetical protein
MIASVTSTEATSRTSKLHEVGQTSTAERVGQLKAAK